MQLTWTNAVFSRIALVSSFCAEKSTFEKNSENNCDRHISPEDLRSQKGSRRGHTRQPRHSWARLGVGPRPSVAWPPRSPPDAPLWTIYCPWPKYRGGFDHISRNTSTLRRRRDLYSGDQKFRSGTLPGRGFGGDHHHRHHHRLSINHQWFPHPCVSSSLL